LKAFRDKVAYTLASPKSPPKEGTYEVRNFWKAFGGKVAYTFGLASIPSERGDFRSL